MDKSQLYWLFLDFIGGKTIEIEGLYLKPERILRDGNTIEFSIQNPNDISFYIGVVREHLDDILFDFSKYVNHKFKCHIDTNYPEIYFNKTLKNDIQSYLNSKKILKLKVIVLVLTQNTVTIKYIYGMNLRQSQELYIMNNTKI